MKSSFIVIVMGILFLAAYPTHATTFYVDAVRGNDSNSGTAPGHPWKTLAQVNQHTFGPGDRILLKSGSVWNREQLRPKGSGSEKHPIIVDEYGGGNKPIIRTEGHYVDAIRLENQSFWEIQNLEITNSDEVTSIKRGVYLLSNEYGDMRHIYIRHLYIHNVNGDDADKANGGIIYESRGDTKPSRFVDLRIEYNTVCHVDRSGITGGSTNWDRRKWYPTLGLVIRHNIVDDTGGDGIVAVAASSPLVEYNVLSNADSRSRQANAGIWAWSTDNAIIQFNEVYLTHGNWDSMGFDSDWNSRGTIIQYNFSHDNNGGFVLVCDDGQQDGRGDIGNRGTIIRYNISQNDHLRVFNISGPITDTYIYNNTVYVRNGIPIDIVQYYNWHGLANGTYFFNNILDIQSHGRIRLKTAAVSEPGYGDAKQQIFDNNLYFGADSDWPEDRDAIRADPKFVNPAKAARYRDVVDYELLPGSAAIGSGKRIPHNGGRDILGHKVSECSGPSLGAVETSKCRPAQ